QIGGHKFRRQRAIGPYIVDFVCLEKHVVVEVDGGQHHKHQTYDARRDGWLRGKGFTVLRFWDDEVLKQVENVKQVSGKHYVPPLQFSPATGAKKIEATELIRQEPLRMSNLTSNIIEVEDSLEAANDWFCREKLSDGLPIVPPTPERVERMLDGT